MSKIGRTSYLTLTSLFQSLPSSSFSSSIPLTDQGFFISGNLYIDEYSSATISDLPEDEMTVYDILFLIYNNLLLI